MPVIQPRFSATLSVSGHAALQWARKYVHGDNPHSPVGDTKLWVVSASVSGDHLLGNLSVVLDFQTQSTFLTSAEALRTTVDEFSKLPEVELLEKEDLSLTIAKEPMDALLASLFDQ